MNTHSTPFSRALTATLREALGPEAENVIPMYLPMHGDLLRRRLNGETDGWTLDEVHVIAQMIGLSASTLLAVVTKVVDSGLHPHEAALELAQVAQVLEPA